MGLYAKYVLPRLINSACGSACLEEERKAVVTEARGVVLEIGIGAGHNLPYYDTEKVDRVIGLEPSLEMWRYAEEAVDEVSIEVELVEGSAEEIPLPDDAIDTIVITFTLCSIPDPGKALAEMKRVLRPGGELRFCEHGLAPEPKVRKWQNRLTPFWKRIGGGCHLNREIAAIIERAGFTVHDLDPHYIEGPRISSYQYRGRATLPTPETVPLP